MRKAMYESNNDCILLKRQQAVELFNLSASTIERIAKKCGAKVKIGGSSRYRKDILMKYFDSLI